MTRSPYDYSPYENQNQPIQRRPPVIAAILLAGLLVVGLWFQEIVDQFILDERLDYFGIRPRNPDTFWHIFSAPFLHGGFEHLIANTVPIAVLAFMSAMRSIGRFMTATMIIMIVGGSLVWMFARGGSIHLGASELVFGYLGYLLGTGWWERTPAAIGVAVVAFVLYGSILWGVLPSNPYISWEAHLFGFIGGLMAALFLHKRTQPIQ